MASTPSTSSRKLGPLRSLGSVAAVLALSVPLTACATGDARTSATPIQRPTEGNVASSRSTNDQRMEVVDIHADYAWVYSEFEELFKHSDAVVMGKVSGIEYRVSPEFDAYTVTTVKVNKVFAGDVEPGSTINVIEPGGVMSKADAIKSTGRDLPVRASDENASVRVTYDGAPGRSRGEQVVYFLNSRLADATLDRPHFVPVGPLAEFVVTGGTAQRFVPDGWTQSPMKMSVGDLERQLNRRAGD